MNSIKMSADLSIVIVSYNTLEMTRACLASVYENAGPLSIQVIVVDNDSKDGSVAMVQGDFPQVELILNHENKGFAAANNQGFRVANGAFVLLLNSDTVVLGDVLDRSVQYLKNRPEVGAMGCRVLNTDRSMQSTCSGYPTLSRLLMMTTGLDRLSSVFDRYRLRSWLRDSERDVEVISGCYMLVRREIIENIGGLDESFFFFGEETDWCLQMRKAGWSLKFAPVGEIIHHGGGSVKKLNYRRDVMLTDATIRLHKKNGGLLRARLAFLILFLFNGSRALFWMLVSLVKPSGHDRAEHFRRVFGSSMTIWPRS